MANSARPVVIGGNWKMYKTIEESVRFIQQLAPMVTAAKELVYLAVPFTAIHTAAETAKNTRIVIGAQNMHEAVEGAFTGEVSAPMLRDAGAKFVLLGHSERRHIYHESDALINKKIKLALQEKLKPVLCIGETLQQREQGNYRDVLSGQIKSGLEGIKKEHLHNLILTYEPVWAIGTNRPATPKIAQQAHEICRQCLQEIFGREIAERTAILYGGSVKTDNAAHLIQQPDIDGLLIGGASLGIGSFSEIIHETNKYILTQELNK